MNYCGKCGRSECICPKHYIPTSIDDAIMRIAGLEVENEDLRNKLADCERQCERLRGRIAAMDDTAESVKMRP
jgi:hypothetical protein